MGVDPAQVQVPVVGGHAGITILPLISQVLPGSLPPCLVRWMHRRVDRQYLEERLTGEFRVQQRASLDVYGDHVDLSKVECRLKPSSTFRWRTVHTLGLGVVHFVDSEGLS